jgi:tetratricopeptide (TPR) repeat protein
MAKRTRLNMRVVILVVALLVIIGGGGLFVYIKQLPQNPDVHAKQAEAELKKETPDWEKAKTEYRKAISASKGDQRSQYVLAFADLLWRQASEDTSLSTVRQHELRNAAIGELKKDQRINSTFLETGHRLTSIMLKPVLDAARYAARQQQAGQAVSAFTFLKDYIDIIDPVIEQDPQNPVLYQRRAQVYTELAKLRPKEFTEAALADWRQAIKLDPHNIELWRDLAQTMVDLEQAEDLEAVVNQAIEMNPDESEVYLIKANVLERQGAEDQEVLAALQKAIDVDPQEVSSYFELADFYLGKDDIAGAKDVIARAEAIDSDGYRISLAKARIAFMEGDRAGGIAVLERGFNRLTEKAAAGDIEQDGTPQAENQLRNVRARILLAYQLGLQYLEDYFREQDVASLEKAKTYHNVLLKLSNRQPHQQAINGLIAYAEKNWHEAKRSLEAARNGGVYNARIAFSLINTYNHLGMPDLAEQEVNRTERALGSNRSAFFEIQRVDTLVASRRYDEAVRHLNMLAQRLPDNQQIHDRLWGVQILQGAREDLPPGEMSSVIRRWAARRADALVQEGNLTGATDLLNKMLAKDPASKQAVQRMVQIQLAQGRIDEAQRILDQAIQADPDDRALQRLRQLILTDAEDRYDVVLSFADEEEDPLARAIEKYQAAQRYNRPDDADAFLQEAIEIDPSDSRVITLVFQRALNEKQWDQAQQQVERLRDQQDPNWPIYQAQIEYAQGDYEATKTTLQQFLELGEHQGARILLAQTLINQEEYDEAEKHLKAALRNNSRLVSAMKGLAEIARVRERYDEYEDWLTRAWQEPVGKADPWIRENYLKTVTQREDPGKAIEIREGRLRAEPDNMENLWLLAKLYEQVQMTPQAIEAYRQGLTKTGSLTWAVALANAYARTNQMGMATEMLQNMLNNAQDDETKARIYVAWGSLLAATSETEASFMFDKAKELAADAIFPYVAQSDYLFEKALRLGARGEEAKAQEAHKESVDLLEEALAIEPENKSLRQVLYMRYINAHEYDKALEGFRQLLEKDDSDLNARIGFARALVMKDRFDEAYQQYMRVLQMSPGYANAYRGLAEMYQRQNQWQEALQAWENAVQSSPGNVQLRMQLARFYQNAEQTRQAADAYLQVIDENPRYKPAYEAMISLFLRNGQTREALAWSQQAQEAFPADVSFVARAAGIYQNAGQWPEAIAQYRKALQINANDPGLIRSYIEALLISGDADAARQAIGTYQSYPGMAPVAQAVAAVFEKGSDGDADAALQQFIDALAKATAEDAAGNEGLETQNIDTIWSLMVKSLPLEKVAANMTDIVKVDEKHWRLNFHASQVFKELGVEYYPQAEQWARRAVMLTGRDNRREALGNLASLYEAGRKTSQYHQAYLPKLVEAYNDILRLNRDDVVACNNLAYLYVDVMDEPQKALPLIQRALEQMPGSSNLIDTHAWALAKLGRYDEAEEKLRDVLQRSGDKPSADILYHMGYVKEKTGDASEARRYYIWASERLGNQEDNPLREKLDEALMRVTANSKAG